MTQDELIRKLMLLPRHIEADFASEEGIMHITDTELEHFTARWTIKRYRGVDIGERPRLLVVLPHDIRSLSGVDIELDASFKKIRLLKQALIEQTLLVGPLGEDRP
jgi:hypothetical protein